MISPRKIHMEPKSHPIEKEKSSEPNHIFRFHVNLPGCCSSPFGPIIYGSWERPAPDAFTILCLDPLKKISMDTLIIHSLIWISRKFWRDLETTDNPSMSRRPHLACSSFWALQEQILRKSDYFLKIDPLKVINMVKVSQGPNSGDIRSLKHRPRSSIGNRSVP